MTTEQTEKTISTQADEQVPEVFVTCDECGGEGAIEKWETVSRWSIDPPCGHVVPCTACNGAGGYICEAEGDAPRTRPARLFIEAFCGLNDIFPGDPYPPSKD